MLRWWLLLSMPVSPQGCAYPSSMKKAGAASFRYLSASVQRGFHFLSILAIGSKSANNIPPPFGIYQIYLTLKKAIMAHGPWQTNFISDHDHILNSWKGAGSHGLLYM